MADYGRLRVKMDYSEESAFVDSEATSKWDDYEPSCDEYRSLKLQVDTTAVSLDMTDFGTVKTMAVKNLDSTNFVVVTWTDSAANANTQKCQAGSILVIPDINPATNPTFDMDTAAGYVKVFIIGTAA